MKFAPSVARRHSGASGFGSDRWICGTRRNRGLPWDLAKVMLREELPRRWRHSQECGEAVLAGEEPGGWPVSNRGRCAANAGTDKAAS